MDNINAVLMDAVLENNYKKVKTALKDGADANYRMSDLKLTPLMSIVGDNINIAKILLEHGANLNEISLFGYTPLIANSSIGNIKVVNLLLRKGCSLNNRNYCGMTALHFSCNEGYTNVTKSLINYGAKIDIQDDKGNTPLMLALLKNHPDDAILLLKNNANRKLVDNVGFDIDTFIFNIEDISKKLEMSRLLR